MTELPDSRPPLYLFTASLYADNPTMISGMEPVFQLVRGMKGAEVRNLTRGAQTAPEAQFFLGGVSCNAAFGHESIADNSQEGTAA